MEVRNLINLSLDDLDRYVYRIISLKRLKELLLNEENVLVKPALWDDPFENFILNSKVRLKSGELATFGFRDDFFGQCWTLNKASDAMWRIYSPDSAGVGRDRGQIPSSRSSDFNEKLFIKRHFVF